MEKQIARWSYFVGVGSVVVAVLWRVLAALQWAPKQVDSLPHTISYKTLQQGSLLMFAITVATAAYVYVMREGK